MTPISSMTLQALVLWEDKYLNVSGEYMEVWCVPSATHVTCKSEPTSFLIFGKFFAVVEAW